MRWPDARTWGTTAEERRLAFACDGTLPRCDDVLFRAVTVAAPPATLFRWLCQLRVAPYSYDWIDNFGRRSPRQLIAGLERLEVGQSVMRMFELIAFEPDRHITVRSRPSRWFGQFAGTYAVVPIDDRPCRLVVKLILAYPQYPALALVVRRLGPWGDFIMMRKQLLNLKALAERDALSERKAEGGRRKDCS